MPTQQHNHATPSHTTVLVHGLQRAGNIGVQAFKDLFQDSGPQWAAAVAYYSLLSIFPLLLAIVSIAAAFVDQEWAVARVTDVLGRFIPQGVNQMRETISQAIAERNGVSVLSILALLWSGSRVFGVITKALNVAYDVDETYGFFKRLVVEVVMLATIGVIFLIAFSVPTLLTLLRTVFSAALFEQTLLSDLLEAGIPALLLLGAFFVTYRFVPRRRPHWRAAATGAVVATLLVLVARPLFWNYVHTFGRYNLIYGSVAVVVLLVLWAWVAALILLFGGELAAHVQAMYIEGRSAQDVAQHHEQRSSTHKRSHPIPLATWPKNSLFCLTIF